MAPRREVAKIDSDIVVAVDTDNTDPSVVVMNDEVVAAGGPRFEPRDVFVPVEWAVLEAKILVYLRIRPPREREFQVVASKWCESNRTVTLGKRCTGLTARSCPVATLV
jgi:hypothetical protein